MNYNAALVNVGALLLYSAVFVGRQLFPGTGKDTTPINIALLLKTLALGILLLCAAALVPAADAPAMAPGRGDTARHLLQMISAYVLPWVIVAVVLAGSIPVLYALSRLIVTGWRRTHTAARED